MPAFAVSCIDYVRVPITLAHVDVVQPTARIAVDAVFFSCVKQHGHAGEHDFGVEHTRLRFLLEAYEICDRALTGLAAVIYSGADERNDAGQAFFEKMDAAWCAMTAARDVTYAELLAHVERRGKGA